MSDWQPINTAPKDGRNILAWMSPTWVEGMYWADGEWFFASDGDSTPPGRNKPMYWQPFPEQPSATP